MNDIFTHLKDALAAGSLLSIFGAIALCYIGGIVSSFTPCIYPMIPITIGLIGGSPERSVKDGWVLSSLYVLGMSLIYAILGIVAALSGRIFGSMTNSPAWYIGLGVVLTLSALWMMDVIKFDPNVLLHKFSRKKHHHNPNEPQEATKLGAFILGASSGFIAAPCTTPVLTTVLSYIATEKSIVLGAMMMFSFALGLGTILVVIGTFTGAVKILPKSGKWLVTMKLFSGYLILALAGYFIFKAGTYS